MARKGSGPIPELERQIEAAHIRNDADALRELQAEYRSRVTVTSGSRGYRGTVRSSHLTMSLPEELVPPPTATRDTDGTMPTLFGHFAVFNQWTEIASMWEGDFVERIQPGAFAKTFAENRQNMRVTLNHGSDPQAGDKPLGPITELREDKEGAYYEVALLDTSYNQDILRGLEKNLYGASFRFRVMKEGFEEKVKPSDYNPRALPERTIKEASVEEFGPVTFPAYTGASAFVRSITDEQLTDEQILRAFVAEPERFRRFLALSRSALSQGAESSTHSESGSRLTAVAVTPVVPAIVTPKFNTREDFHRWLTSRI